MVAQIMEAYPNDVKFVYKNYPLPFHKQAMPAAKAAVDACKVNSLLMQIFILTIP